MNSYFSSWLIRWSVLFMIYLSGMSVALADDEIFSLTPKSNDYSLQFLGYFFGKVGHIFPLQASPTIPAMLFTFLNKAIFCVIAGAVLTYTMLMSIFNTAQDGEFLGKKFSSLWIPMRTIIGFAILVPRASGYSSIQVCFLWIVTQGIGAANYIWAGSKEYSVISLLSNEKTPLSLLNSTATMNNHEGASHYINIHKKVREKIKAANDTDAQGMNNLFYSTKNLDRLVRNLYSMSSCAKAHVTSIQNFWRVARPLRVAIIDDPSASEDAKQKARQEIKLFDSFKPSLYTDPIFNISHNLQYKEKGKEKHVYCSGLNQNHNTADAECGCYVVYNPLPKDIAQTVQNVAIGFYGHAPAQFSTDPKDANNMEIRSTKIRTGYIGTSTYGYFGHKPQDDFNRYLKDRYFSSMKAGKLALMYVCLDLLYGNLHVVTPEQAHENKNRLIRKTKLDLEQFNQFSSNSGRVGDFSTGDRFNFDDDYPKRYAEEFGWIMAGAMYSVLLSANSDHTKVKNKSGVVSEINPKLDESLIKRLMFKKDKSLDGFGDESIEIQVPKEHPSIGILYTEGFRSQQGISYMPAPLVYYKQNADHEEKIGNLAMKYGMRAVRTRYEIDLPVYLPDQYRFWDVQSKAFNYLNHKDNLKTQTVYDDDFLDQFQTNSSSPHSQNTKGLSALLDRNAQSILRLSSVSEGDHVRLWSTFGTAQVIKWAFDDFVDDINRPMSKFFQSYTSNMQNRNYSPVVMLQELGNSLLHWSFDEMTKVITWITGLELAATGVMAFSSPALGTFLGGVLGLALLVITQLILYIGFSFVLMTPFMYYGAALAFYIPFIPMIHFYLGVISWLVMVIEAMLAAPLVALGMIYPEGHDLLGKSEPAIMIMVEVFFQPIMLVLGLIFSLSVFCASVWLLNSVFWLGAEYALLNIDAYRNDDHDIIKSEESFGAINAYIMFPATVCIYCHLVIRCMDMSMKLYVLGLKYIHQGYHSEVASRVEAESSKMSQGMQAEKGHFDQASGKMGSSSESGAQSSSQRTGELIKAGKKKQEKIDMMNDRNRG